MRETKSPHVRLPILIIILSMGISLGFAGSENVGKIYVTVETMTGDPLNFANVVVRGTGIGTVTDSDGVGVVHRVPPGVYEVKVTYLGYMPHTDTLRVEPGKIVVTHIVLEESRAIKSGVVIRAPTPLETRRGVPLGEVIPYLSSSSEVKAYRVAHSRIPEDTTIVGPTLSRNQVRTLEWLLLEKEGFNGGIWRTPVSKCMLRPTLVFRFQTDSGEGVAEVDLTCMLYSLRAGELTDAGVLKQESARRFVGFALRLFPKDPVLLYMHRFNQLQSLMKADDCDAAIEIIMELILADHTDPAVWQSWAACLSQKDDPQAAVAALMFSKSIGGEDVPVGPAVKNAIKDARSAAQEFGAPDFIRVQEDSSGDQVETWFWVKKQVAISFVLGVKTGEVTW